MKKLLAILLAALMCVLVFASCGKNSDKDNSSTDTGSGKVNEEKKNIVVGYTTYEPMNYLDEDGKLVGFDTELAKAVFEKLGYNVVFKEIEWESKYSDLASGNIDCIWNGFTANAADDDGVQRSEKVDFSYYYMENQQAIVVKAEDAQAAADTAWYADKIGYVEAGSAGKGYAEKALTGSIVKEAVKQTDAILQVNSGAASFAVVDIQLAKGIAGKGDYAGLALVETMSSDTEFYAVGFKKGSELTAKVNEQLEALAADGTIAKIAEKYGVSNTAIVDYSNQK